MAIEESKVEAIFFAALEKQSSEDCAAYLDSACADDPSLRQRVEALLNAQPKLANFLQGHASEMVPMTLLPPPAELPGAQIGPYKLLQQIGEGGMGTVFMAEQTQPVQRKVALKLIKPGMDSGQIIARFEAERQALAMMDHVNIARVLDAGATESGRPYFVMELINGVPITKYCDDNHLTPRERLELFVPVCQAIQHAHQKGVIHRDIKPSNVMVTLYDGKPVPKVIDFGVAKATEQKLTERTLFTQFGTMVGTLEYMSPEQAEMSALGVDTRSDIYSLGVLLYELLTGSTPLSHKRIREAAYGEVLRMIREEEAPRPSTRLSESGEALASISAQRHTEPAKLTKLVRGELDWIVMKCLEKDRNRRYETANGFAADVQRYLNDETVQACPPSAGYRLHKFARRNKRMLATAGVLVLAMVLGTSVSMWQALRATEAEGLAEERLETASANYQTAEEQRQRAEASEREAKTNEGLAKDAQKQSAESLKDALAAVDQMLTRVGQERLANVPQMEPVRRELMQDALKFYQKFLQKNSADPLIRRETAMAYRRLAEVHRNLGQYAEAETHYSKAFALFAELATVSPLEPSTRSDLSVAHLELANCLDHLGKREEHEKCIRRAVEIAEQLVKEYPNDPNYADRLADATFTLAGLIGLTRPEEAEKMLRRNLTLTNTPYLRANIHRYLGVLLTTQKRSKEAEQATRQALEEYESIASANPSSNPNWVRSCIGETLHHLATLVAADGRLQEAEEIWGRAISVLDKLAIDYPAGPNYRNSQAHAHQGRASLLRKLNRTAEAEQAYRRVLDLFVKLAADFPAVNAYLQTAFDQCLNLGQILLEAGRAEDAVNVYRQALDLSGKLSVDAPAKLNHLQGLVRTHVELGGLLAKGGKEAEAETAYRQALEIQEKLDKDFAGKLEERRDLAQSHLQAAELFRAVDRLQDAEKLCRLAIDQAAKVAIDPPTTADGARLMGQAYGNLAFLVQLKAGRTDDALATLREALSRFDKLATEFPDVPTHRYWLANMHCAIGKPLHDMGHRAQAEEGNHRAIAILEKLVVECPAELEYRTFLGVNYGYLADHHTTTKNSEEAEKTFRKAMDLWKQMASEFPAEQNYRVQMARSQSGLAVALAQQGKHNEAVDIAADLDTHELNNLAWQIMASSEAHPQAIKFAVGLAQKAVARAPKAGHIVNTLGIAYYRAGDWKAAIDTLKQSDALYGGRLFSFNAFFIVMAHWQRGEKDQARKWYAPALIWMEKHAPKNEELIRFRAEAASLLGLPERVSPEYEQVKADGVEYHTLVLEADPEAAWAYGKRGGSYAELGQWKEAAAAFSRAIELHSDDLDGVWLPLALLRLKAGQTDDYRRLVSAALDRFGKTEEPRVATNLAILAKLAPGSADELAVILQILERTLAHKPDDGLAVAIRAHLLIRAGRAAKGVALLEAMVAATPDGQGDQRFNLLFLALGRMQLGRDAEALEAFRAAERWQDTRFNAWFHQIDFDRTRDELATMLGVNELPHK